ncbi:hypothetical protein BDZ85DRAFT_113006 [Elsinoe ampelina]|uniref:Uncharacterized protein n=1 Tax=Elsinoe ampelina TaxID=302913 RepID=A0A6A6GDE3_9PEZI|nr:hypothetical protein BDZ85DRAFT_113006 [Elsinoe ampelina]
MPGPLATQDGWISPWTRRNNSSRNATPAQTMVGIEPDWPRRSVKRVVRPGYGMVSIGKTGGPLARGIGCCRDMVASGVHRGAALGLRRLRSGARLPAWAMKDLVVIAPKQVVSQRLIWLHQGPCIDSNMQSAMPVTSTSLTLAKTSLCPLKRFISPATRDSIRVQGGVC